MIDGGGQEMIDRGNEIDTLEKATLRWIKINHPDVSVSLFLLRSKFIGDVENDISINFPFYRWIE